jgi:hypothetical protein
VPADGAGLALVVNRKAGQDVAERSIELFIGRLITDEGFREEFIHSPSAAIRMFVDAGSELTTVEVAALLGTRADFWERVADQVDPRLQKASLHSFSRRDS